MADDLRIEVRARSSVMARWRESLGLTQVDAARLAGVPKGVWNALEVLRKSAMGRRGEWLPTAVKIAESMGMSPESIWTEGVLSITNPKRSMDVDAQQFGTALEDWSADRFDALPPSESFDLQERDEAIGDVLETLTEREQLVIELLYRDDMTLVDAGLVIGVTKERVRQIEGKALRKIRHPSRCKLLVPFIDMPQGRD